MGALKQHKLLLILFMNYHVKLFVNEGRECITRAVYEKQKTSLG